MRAAGVMLIGLLSPVAAAAAPPTPSVEQTLIDLEKQSWAAWQTKDLAFWERHLSSDHVELDGPGGPQDRTFVIKGIAERRCDVASYNLDKFTFRQLGSDAGMLVYHAVQEFACGDKRVPSVGWVTSLYRRRDGRWQNLLFEHVAEQPAPAKP